MTIGWGSEQAGGVTLGSHWASLCRHAVAAERLLSCPLLG
jgi:hypothetical protein